MAAAQGTSLGSLGKLTVQQLKSRLSNYEVPEEQISADPENSSTSPATDPPSVIMPKQKTYVVQAGDSISSISVKMYGSPLYIDAILEANRETMPSKNHLRVGQQLAMPKVSRP